MDIRKSNNPEAQEEHETHTTALVLLTLATLVICFVILTKSGDINLTDNDEDMSTTTEETMQGSHGSIIPQEPVETTPAASTSELPAGIFIAEDNIIDNYTAALGETRAQHVVSFTAEQSVDELFGQYESWLTENGFTIEDRVEDEYGAKLVATSGESRLVISITHIGEGEGARVMLDYASSSS